MKIAWPAGRQRQIAYDRLLERLCLVDEAWIVRGAVALLARGLGVRAAIDVDVYRGTGRELAEDELRLAAARPSAGWSPSESVASSRLDDRPAPLNCGCTARSSALGAAGALAVGSMVILDEIDDRLSAGRDG